ncbi:hypothetical protein [Dactylosporangium sp. CA-233914]|uniref:hypothetical protein n=1 Tax=Dactylosporangium sp. CA-233914 TaxID=3239934 RepID=UPI003D928C58
MATPVPADRWRSRIEWLVAAAAPDWPPPRVEAASLWLPAMVEGASAPAAADPRAVQEAMLAAGSPACGLEISTR